MIHNGLESDLPSDAQELSLHSALVLFVGKAAAPLAAKLATWLTSDVQGGFCFHCYDEQATTPAWICRTGQQLQQHAGKNRREFVSPTDISQRMLLIAGTQDMETVGAAVDRLLAAQSLWQQTVPTLRLEYQVVLFGPDRENQVRDSLVALRGRFARHDGSSQPTILYVGDCTGVLLLESVQVLAGVEVLVALLCMADYRQGSSLRDTLRFTVGQDFFIALEQFTLPALHKEAMAILLEAVHTELKVYLLAQHPSRHDLHELLATLEPWRTRSDMAPMQTPEFLQESYERALPELLSRSAKFVIPNRGFAPLLQELALVIEQEGEAARAAVQPHPGSPQAADSWWRRLVYLLRMLLHQHAPSHPEAPTQPVALGENPRQNTLAIFLEDLRHEFARPVTTLPIAELRGGYPAAAGHARNEETLEIEPSERAQLLRFACEEVHQLELSALVALLNLPDKAGMTAFRNEAVQRTRGTYAELRKRLRASVERQAALIARKRWDDGTWVEFLYCNLRSPDSEVFSFFCTAFSAEEPALPRSGEGQSRLVPLAERISLERIFVLRWVGMK